MKTLLGLVTLFSLMLLMGAQRIPGPGGTAPSGGGGSVTVTAYKMNEGSGLTFTDYSGNSNTGTLSGGGAVTWQSNSGLPGTTPSFNGTGGATAATASYTNFSAATSFCVGVWAQTSYSTEQAIASTETSSSSYQGWQVGYTYGAHTQQFALINTYPTNLILVNATAAIGGLHYLGYQYSGSSTAAGVTLYVDGSSVATTTVYDTLSASPASGTVMYVGNRFGNSDNMYGPMAFLQVVSPCAWNSAKWAANYAAGPGLY